MVGAGMAATKASDGQALRAIEIVTVPHYLPIMS
jgi:hypothetical protein